jgi:intracellular septation protein
MKILLDYLPIALFAGAYYLRDIYFATVVLIVALFVQSGIIWGMTRRVPRMQLSAAVLALVFGGITLVLRDPIKTLIQRFLEANITLPPAVWSRLNLLWVAFFLFCGSLNLYVAYHFNEQTWVNFKLFGMFGLTIVFVLLQSIYLARHVDTGKTGAQ